MEQFDYQCMLGVTSSVNNSWYASNEDPAVVAQWYRRRLVGYDETAPQQWRRLDDKGGNVVIVGPADAWPPDSPRPSVPIPGHCRTVIVESSMTRH